MKPNRSLAGCRTAQPDPGFSLPFGSVLRAVPIRAGGRFLKVKIDKHWEK